MIPLNELGAAYHERPSQKIRALLLQKPEQGYPQPNAVYCSGHRRGLSDEPNGGKLSAV